MTRRELIALLGGTGAAWPLAVRAQQAGKLPTIGFMGTSTPAAWAEWLAAFQNRLRELGWIEGRTINIEYRWAESRDERFTQIAAEFTRLNVDVIVTAGAGIIAAKRVTSTIPIVFALSNDPVGTGLVASLARPGGNITGLSTQLADVPGKRLQLMQEMVPALRRLGLMFNAGFPDAVLEMREISAAALGPQLQVNKLEIRQAEDIVTPLSEIANHTDALYVCPDPLVLAQRSRINSLAVSAGLPVFSGFREFAIAGALMSYGPNVPDLFRRAAEFADRVLRGGRPADIPVEQPTKFDLVINVVTAKTLGLSVPDKLIALADAVIE
jgi:putative tryptophan/tyrosine transport system substrate-binding protein